MFANLLSLFLLNTGNKSAIFQVYTVTLSSFMITIPTGHFEVPMWTFYDFSGTGLPELATGQLVS